MRVFVAAWFYPPVTSSEGIVTYKLLRCSAHEYDVFSSTSRLWSYRTPFKTFGESNIHTYSIDTESIDEWVEACVNTFEELYPTRQYDCIMTRSTPPESILVGERIKKKHPQIKWIASLADPVANNPYEIYAYIDNNPLLNNVEKKKLKQDLLNGDESVLAHWETREEKGIQLLCKLRRWEIQVVQQADMIISPSARQLRYINGEAGWNAKYYPVPHSFCEDFYPKEVNKREDKIVFVYTGYSDQLRSLEPIVRAVKLLKESNSPALGKLLFRFVGNIPRQIQDIVLNFELEDYIHIEAPVDYYESLRIMKEADWLIHVDAYFQDIMPGGSLFFAGKLSDYLGTGNPVFALTGPGSPADRIIKTAGGISTSYNIDEIAGLLEKIAFFNDDHEISREYIETFNAVNVSRNFDKKLEMLCGQYFPLREDWPEAAPSKERKLLTICVPSYNVQRCLDRCLYTLISCKQAPYMEIIVVDDGSKDHTRDIADTYADHYPGIVKVIHKENGGHGSTINTAIAVAKGEYFRVVDGDDWIDSNAMDAVLLRILDGSIDSDVVSSPYHIVNLETGSSYPFEQDYEVETDRSLRFEELDVEKAYLTMASIMVKLSALKKANMQIQEHTFFVDVEYILFPIPFVNTVTFTKEHIYKYSQGSAEQSIHIPNMVKRYDHHERVMRRVIQYRKDTPMGEAQAKYYDSILKRLLYSHYSLCTVYDPDKEQSYLKLKDFDTFLLSTNPELAKWAQKAMPVVGMARRCDYRYSRVKHSPANLLQEARIRCKAWLLSHKPLAKKILFNKLTYKIGTSRFFSEGKGAVIRNKIYNALTR